MFGGGGGGGTSTKVIEAQTQATKEAAPAPKVADKAVQEAAAEAIRRRKSQKGYRSTILASSFMGDDQRTKLKTLGS